MIIQQVIVGASLINFIDRFSESFNWGKTASGASDSRKGDPSQPQVRLEEPEGWRKEVRSRFLPALLFVPAINTTRA